MKIKAKSHGHLLLNLAVIIPYFRSQHENWNFCSLTLIIRPILCTVLTRYSGSVDGTIVVCLSVCLFVTDVGLLWISVGSQRKTLVWVHYSDGPP